MSDNQQPEWPKSFRSISFVDDEIAFSSPCEEVRDACGVKWTYDDAARTTGLWEPIPAPQQQPAPAPSQDDVKADVAKLAAEARRLISELADAVERLAK